jgi:hypothetical protein
VKSHRISRRHFFYGTLLAGAVPSGGFGSTPSLSALGYTSPNEKLNIAAVGVGIRGPAILFGAAATENIVALCDVDEARAARGFAQYPGAKKYKDYRKMFDAEGKNIDAVMIATPDHMHTPVALLAMQQGKHVYCEKPLTRTAWEAQLMAEAAAKHKVATQMGNQGWSHEGTKTACEIVWSGEIGDVQELHAWTGMIYGGQPKIPATGPEATPVPPTLDWDLWLGCAAPRAFNPLITNQWRAFIDFSPGGSLGDWLVHNLGPAHLALQLGKVSPTSVECVFVEGKSQWLWPLRAHIVFEFPARGSMPPITVHTYQNMRGDFQDPPGMAEGERLFPPMNNLTERGRPFVDSGDGTMLVSTQLTVDGKPIAQQGRPPRFPGRRGFPPGVSQDPKLRAPGNGAVFVGSKGYMATSARGEGVWLLPASRWAEYKLPPQVLQRGVNHQQDWIRACKGGAPGVSDFAVAAEYIEWLALGAIALRVPGKLLWDANRRRFRNSEEANRLLKPYLRKGWELKV